METLLIGITVISVITTIVAVVILWRTQNSERQRSEARIAALAAAAEVHGDNDGGWKQIAGEWQWVASGQTAAAHVVPLPSSHAHTYQERTDVYREPVALHHEPADAAPAIAFGTVQRGEATTGRLPLIAAAVLIIILGSALLFLRSSSPQTGMPAPTQVAHTSNDPLELVTLGHAREANSLTISGTVRNPASGHKLEGLTAVVSLLDASGALLSTKDVPLDYRALGPGEEAPFKISVPDPGAIARYRVSFRAGTEVVPHVDRRAETKLAIRQ